MGVDLARVLQRFLDRLARDLVEDEALGPHFRAEHPEEMPADDSPSRSSSVAR
jgi:hypothetical protein